VNKTNVSDDAVGPVIACQYLETFDTLAGYGSILTRSIQFTCRMFAIGGRSQVRVKKLCQTQLDRDDANAKSNTNVGTA
jgi:hypothetical protein